MRALQTRLGGHGGVRRLTKQSRETLAAVSSALVRNDRVARRNRDYLDLHGVTAINLVSTPRAGKTSLLESTIPTLMRDYRVAVVASDIASDDDVRRLRALAVPTIQVMTGSSRHLDANMLQRALRDIVTPELDRVVHRERRQSRLPGEPESRSASQRRDAVRAGRRRLAAARAGDVPRRRPGVADQDRPARSGASSTICGCTGTCARSAAMRRCSVSPTGAGSASTCSANGCARRKRCSRCNVASRAPGPPALPENPRVRYN